MTDEARQKAEKGIYGRKDGLGWFQHYIPHLRLVHFNGVSKRHEVSAGWVDQGRMLSLV